jgi:hypothetical protein
MFPVHTRDHVQQFVLSVSSLVKISLWRQEAEDRLSRATCIFWLRIEDKDSTNMV